jgi:hypothetical protein
LGNCAVLSSNFHVPSKALCALAETGVRNATNNPIHSSFFIAYAPWNQPGFLIGPWGNVRHYSSLRLKPQYNDFQRDQ